MKRFSSLVLTIALLLSIMLTGIFCVATSAEEANSTDAKFTITWRNSNGELIGTTSCDYGETPIFEGETPVRESDSQYTYTFTGWKPEIKAAYSDADYIAVYSKTARNSYTITYNANGGSNAPASQTKAPGQTIKLNSSKPTWQNHVFWGWICAYNGALYQAGQNFNIDADVTLYAVWVVPCSHCGGQGGSFTNSTCTTCNGTGEGSIVKCAFCRGTGRKCANCGNISVTIIQGLGQVCSSCGSTSRRDCASCDGVGTWTTDHCTTCEGEGITSSYSACSWCDGDPYAENSFPRDVYLYSDDSLIGSKTIYTKRPYQLIVPSKTGYTFIGWFDSPDGGTQYTNSEGVSLSVCPNSPSSKLYAHWSLNYYTITYDCEQIVNTDDMPVVYTVEDEDFILNSHSPREHYNLYWSVLGTKVESFDTSIAQDIVVKGVWDPINYTITYNLDGGTANNKTTYNIETGTFSLVEPTKAGYIFAGWTGSNGNVPEKNVTISTDQPQNLSFTANWTIVAYTITYELFGGENSLKNPTTFTINDNVVLKNATKNYYTFAGWYLDSAFTQKITNINGYHGDLTLYARFVPNSFTATFDPEEGHLAHYNITLVWGGNLQNEVISYKTGDTFYPYEVDVPSRSGYLFNGWYLDSSFSTPLPETYTIASDTKLYAKWFNQSVTNAEELTLGDYRYTCYGNASKTVNFYVSPEHSGETVVSYYMYGYKYDGVMESGSRFYITDLTTGTTLFSKNTLNGSGYTVNSFTSITLVAGHTYQLYIYTINNSYFNGEADIIISIGEDPFPSTFVSSAFATYEEKYGETIQYPVPIRKDYDFVGWYDIDGNPISSVWDYTTDKTFYPQWKLHEFSINYNLNGGINSSLNPISYTVVDSTITLLDPSREGYTFLGWYTGPNFRNQITEINCEDRLDYTLYAKWISDFFGVNYELNGGVNNPSNKQRIGRTEEFTLLDPTREGYTFVGWYLEYYYSTKVTTLYGSAHCDQKVYARWTPNSYTVTLDYSGGQNCPTVEFISQGNVIKTVDLYKDTTLSYFTPEAPAANLKFAGWYTNSSYTTLFDFNGIVNYDVTVYAKWVSVNTNYEYVSLGGSYNVSISGIENQYLAIMSPITQTVTVSSASGLDLFGSIYDSNMKLLYSCDDISDANLDFSITFVMEVGEVYYIAYKANQVLVSGNATINVSGTQNPSSFITGDYTAIIERIDVIYASSFELPVPKRNGYVFQGWFDENDTQITDGTWNFATNKTLTAKWAEYYTVVFKDLDGNIISSETYYFGEDIVAPDIPSKAPDETYIYHIKWDNDYTGVCTGDAVYMAVVDAEYIEYTVVFADEDGTVISTMTYHYGDKVTAPSNPTKPADNTYTYTFAGWDSEVVNCAGDATYTATYTQNYINYTIKFVNWDGTVISTKTYHYGDAVTAPANPTRAADKTYTYTFAGWDAAVVNCAGDATYTATYTQNYINYTIKFVNWNGTVISTKTYHYGDAVTVPNNPTRPADSIYTYIFRGWDKMVVNCAGDATYTATYTSAFVNYTIVFKDWDGTVLSSKNNYVYGQAVSYTFPTKPSDNTYTYTFAGWDKPVTSCTGNATYTATYTQTYIDYVVKFVDWDGTVISTKTYHYGDVVTAPANPTRVADETYRYTFSGWDKAVVNCAGNATYTAVYSKQRVDGLQYTIQGSTVTITGYTGSGGNLVIPETIEGLPVTSIGNNAFNGRGNLAGVTIPSRVTSIGIGAFYGCNGLVSITVASGNARYYSEGNCVINKTTKGLVLGCRTSVIPNGVTHIGNEAFSGCGALTSITIPDSVTSIGNRAFYLCTGLTSITIPDSVTSIGNHAFYSCTGLTSITIPDSVTGIGDQAFYRCFRLTSINIPSSVTSIGNQAFYDCQSLTSITVDSGNASYYSKGNCLINKTKKELVLGCKTSVIPNDVLRIGSYAFSNCSSIAIPVSVTSIDSVAFDGSGTTLRTVFYAGTKDQKATMAISVGNTQLTNATWHYEVQPAAFGGKDCYYCADCDDYFNSYGSYATATVTFVDWDGTVISTGSYRWKAEVTVPANPTRAADKTYTYTFAGWDKEVVNCAGNATYTATYTQTYIDYAVTFKNWDGSVISTKTYHWGDNVTAPANPTRAADNTYTYTFKGWDKTVVNCAGNATYSATYTPNYINYTIKFVNWDGTVISSKTYHYGDKVTVPADPVRADDETYTYTFAGWDKTVVNCVGDAIYTATYSREEICRIPSTITSTVYDVQDGKIGAINAGTTVEALLSGIEEGEFCTVYADGEIVAADALVGTGMIVKIMDGEETKVELAIVVAGDVNGDGKISVTDMLAVKAHLLDKEKLDGANAQAADVTDDNKLSITDFIQVKAHLLGKEQISVAKAAPVMAQAIQEPAQSTEYVIVSVPVVEITTKEIAAPVSKEEIL